MKLCIAVAFLMTIGVSMAVILGNGQPGCKTATELVVKNYRNLWDPTSYWVCEEKNVAASSKKCPDMTAWDDSEKKCVDWELWAWLDPVEPPSNP
ncbi:uncharacterized protein LOC129915988 [Episyrphus balteatus]|uniref:uncharacterized protein LOC129915988 n=1 Tax=Episyrphus balteatus TaxID=286459 RepID=UPI0024864E10|nr:uncharacterized protein LOC129915988 [Episyrphus balteatus]